ncbi:hypothetical protein Tco_0459484 [Tanacetum coccineum]
MISEAGLDPQDLGRSTVPKKLEGYDKYSWMKKYSKGELKFCFIPQISLGKRKGVAAWDRFLIGGKGLLGPNGGSGGTIEGRFGKHCGGNGGIGGSKLEVGEGKVESMGGIGGGAFAIHSIVSKDGRGGGGLMARGDVSLDGWVGAGGGEVKSGGVDLGVVGVSTFETLIRSFSEQRSNKNSIKVLFLRSTTLFDCGVCGAEKLCVIPLASQKALNFPSDGRAVLHELAYYDEFCWENGTLALPVLQ